MAPYDGAISVFSAKINRHNSTARAYMAPVPWYGASSNRHMAEKIAIWRLSTAMADLPVILFFTQLRIANWRCRQLAPIVGANWRHGGANKRQLAPIIGAKLAPIAHRQYIGANWRQLAPIGAQDLKFPFTGDLRPCYYHFICAPYRTQR